VEDRVDVIGQSLAHAVRVGEVANLNPDRRGQKICAIRLTAERGDIPPLPLELLYEMSAEEASGTRHKTRSSHHSILTSSVDTNSIQYQRYHGRDGEILRYPDPGSPSPDAGTDP
jgi:hypothetical protein